ncbi:MAG: alpha/beta hydrolase [Pseudomonas sp.]
MLADEGLNIQYQVTPAVSGTHHLYFDEDLVLSMDADEIDRSASGAFSIRYADGLAENDQVKLRLCVEAAPIEACDQVSIRAGRVLLPEQTIEISPAGVAGYLPPRTPIDIDYTILKPTTSARLYYIDDRLIRRRTTSTPVSGPLTIRSPTGLKEGEKRLLSFCLDDESAASTCGYAEVIGGQAPDGVDLPEPFTANDLTDHYQALADCSPVCGSYANVYYGNPGVSWIPDRGDGAPDGLRMDIYYSSADGRLNPEAAPSTLIFYAHSAGSNKESLLTNNRTLLNHLLGISGSGPGVVVAAIDFRHPLRQFEDDLTPSSVDDLSYAIQFARYHAAELNINPDDIFVVGTSLGAGVAIHAAVREIANPMDSSPVRQTSSSIRGVITRDGQSSFAPQWFRNNFLEPVVADRYQRGLLDDEKRLIYGHAIAEVNSKSPLMELLYTTPFIDHKVTLTQYLLKTVDLVHLPNYGLAMEKLYQLHGIEERIRVMESYSGNFGRDAASFISQHRLGQPSQSE